MSRCLDLEAELERQTISMAAALTREVKARESLEEQLETLRQGVWVVSTPHSEPFKLLRDLIEVMDACSENECDKCHADAKTMLTALTGIEEQLEVAVGALHRVEFTLRGSSKTETHAFVEDILAQLNSNPASRQDS